MGRITIYTIYKTIVLTYFSIFAFDVIISILKQVRHHRKCRRLKQRWMEHVQKWAQTNVGKCWNYLNIFYCYDILSLKFVIEANFVILSSNF
jgi:hypothetical protein